MDMNLTKLWKTGEDRGAWRAAAHGLTKSWTQLHNQTTQAWKNVVIFSSWKQLNMRIMKRKLFKHDSDLQGDIKCPC